MSEWAILDRAVQESGSPVFTSANDVRALKQLDDRPMFLKVLRLEEQLDLPSPFIGSGNDVRR